MPKKLSAGLLMYRRSSGVPEVFLVHPGGPFWAKKDQGAWSLPKGEYVDSDDALTAAQREFEEETGFTAKGQFIQLTAIKQPSGKLISAWAYEGNCDPAALRSNVFSGVAASVRETGRVSRSRPGSMVQDRRGEAKNYSWPERISL